jgi:hypothetical protein
MTVFTIPPLYIALKIADQFVWRLKSAGAFLTGKMPMIALAGFVVITQDALAIDHIRQPILEQVIRPSNLTGKLPQHQFSESSVGKNNAAAN